MKKGKKSAVELPHGAPLFSASEEAKARFRHQSLLQDYQDLRKETEVKRKQLEKTKQKKHKLRSEVRFLQRRYKSLMENPSGKNSYILKKRSRNMRQQLMDNDQATKQMLECEVSNTENKASAKHSSITGKDTAMPSTWSAGIDLNMVSMPIGEETEEFHVDWEPLRKEKSKKLSVEEGPSSNDLKLSVCSEIGNGSGRVEKRKITWQDQVALKV